VRELVAGVERMTHKLEPPAHLLRARDWRANFFPVGIAYSIVGGSAWEPTPWRAVQRAAWETLSRPPPDARRTTLAAKLLAVERRRATGPA
jgi:hypothetical protein